MHNTLLRAREKGFTLVEILIVVVVLGVLAGIVIIAVGGLPSTAQKTACATEFNRFFSAFQAYNAANPTAPLSGDATSSSITGATGALTTGSAPLLSKSPTNDVTYSAGFAPGGTDAGHWEFDSTKSPQYVQGNSCK